MQTYVILIVAVVAMASAATAVWAVATAHSARRRFQSALDAAGLPVMGPSAPEYA